MEILVYQSTINIKEMKKWNSYFKDRKIEGKLYFVIEKLSTLKNDKLKVFQLRNDILISKILNKPKYMLNESFSVITKRKSLIQKQIKMNTNPIISSGRIIERLKHGEKFNEFFNEVQLKELRYVYLRKNNELWSVESHYKINDYKKVSVEDKLNSDEFIDFLINRLSVDLVKEIDSFHLNHVQELVIYYTTDFKQINIEKISNKPLEIDRHSERIKFILSNYFEKVKKDETKGKIKMGLLVKNHKNPSIFKKYNNIPFTTSAVAKIKGHQVYLFTAEDMDYKKNKIRARYYNEDGIKVKKTIDFPDIVIDRLKMRGIPGYEQLYEELDSVLFNSTREGGAISKLETYELISKSEIFKQFLIPYSNIENFDELEKFTNSHKKVIVKPSKGSFGDDIIYIEKMGSNYKTILDKKINHFDLNELKSFFQNYDYSDLVIQKYINSTTHTRAPFDIRIHVLKSANGSWSIGNIYPRIGSSKGVTSNLSAGGSTSTWAKFFKEEFSDYEWREFNKQLMKFSIEFADFFQDVISGEVNEIAIDIGIDRESMSLYFFEINANIPGCRFHTMEAAFHIISYAEYLVLKQREEILKKKIGL